MLRKELVLESQLIPIGEDRYQLVKTIHRRGMNVFNADIEEEEKTSAGEDSINKEFLLGCCRVKLSSRYHIHQVD